MTRKTYPNGAIDFVDPFKHPTHSKMVFKNIPPGKYQRPARCGEGV